MRWIAISKYMGVTCTYCAQFSSDRSTPAEWLLVIDDPKGRISEIHEALCDTCKTDGEPQRGIGGE